MRSLCAAEELNRLESTLRAKRSADASERLAGPEAVVLQQRERAYTEREAICSIARTVCRKGANG